MHRVLLTTQRELVSRSWREVTRGAQGWVLELQEGVAAGLAALAQDRWDVWLVDAALIEQGAQEGEARYAPLERAGQLGVMVGVVLESGQALASSRARWLERGTHEVFEAPGGAQALSQQLRVLEVGQRRWRAAQRHQAQGARRGAELLGLNALVHALANSLDQATIIYKVLSILVGLCRRGAVAYLEVVSREDALRAPEQLFSESEAEAWGLGLESNQGEAEPLPLRVVDQIADDRLLVCLRPSPHPSWQRLFERNAPMELRERPSWGSFPGLEPLWHRLQEGVVFLVPLWGREEPLGVLVLAELELDALQEAPLSLEALQSMAALISGSIENARLFDEIHQAYQSLQSAQEQLVHTEKFAAVGHLAAQIAHEINNPASFVISNLSVMLDYVRTIWGFVEALTEGASDSGRRAELDELMRDHEIDFLQEDLEALLDRSLAGMQRIHQVVQDLRYFAHDAGPEPNWVDLEGLLDASLNLIKHELKYRASIERDYGGAPHVFSDANKLSQVFLNLLVNASQALEQGDMERDRIRVGTTRYEDRVLVFVEDTGEGIESQVLPRIFEPFFTTKERGQGTGLGLSISRDILRSLGGDIRVYSERGEGTRFEVMLPIKPDELARDDRVRESGSYRQSPQLRQARTDD